MDTSYNAASGDNQYKFLSELLPAGVQAPVARIAHGPLGAPVQVDPAHPLPVHDPLAASDAGLQAIATLLGTLATAASQAAINALLTTLVAQTDGVEGSLSAILAKLTVDPATATLQSASNALLTTIRDRTPALVSGAQPVVPAAGALVDRSGTITAGGTAQQLAAANASRIGFSVQNLSTTADLWINSLGTAAAVQPSIKLSPGAYFETPPGYGAVGAVSIFGATTGLAFSSREW
jgi:hypothetical protein